MNTYTANNLIIESYDRFDVSKMGLHDTGIIGITIRRSVLPIVLKWGDIQGTLYIWSKRFAIPWVSYKYEVSIESQAPSGIPSKAMIWDGILSGTLQTNAMMSIGFTCHLRSGFGTSRLEPGTHKLKIQVSGFKKDGWGPWLKEIKKTAYFNYDYLVP